MGHISPGRAGQTGRGKAQLRYAGLNLSAHQTSVTTSPLPIPVAILLNLMSTTRLTPSPCTLARNLPAVLGDFFSGALIRAKQEQSTPRMGAMYTAAPPTFHIS